MRGSSASQGFSTQNSVGLIRSFVMPQGEKVAAGLSKAQELEKRYDWLEAADLYEQTLSLPGKKQLLKRGEIQKRQGYCCYRAAFQSDTLEEFKKRMGLSVEAYEEAADLFEGSEDSEHTAKAGSCQATALYCRSWLAEDLSTRQARLDECRKLAKEVLKAYERTSDKAEYGRICNELLECLGERLVFTWSPQERAGIIEEAIKYGKKANEALSEGKDWRDLARASRMLSGFLDACTLISESIEKQEELGQAGLTYAQKALETAKRTEDSYLIGWCCLTLADYVMEVKGDLESALRYREEALELGKGVNDKLLMAEASSFLSHTVWWMALVEEDPDTRRAGFNKALQYTKDAVRYCNLLSHPPLEFDEAQIIWTLAYDETSPTKKQELLEKAIEVGRRDLDHARRSGSPWATMVAAHSLSKALFSLSTMEVMSEKEKLLEEAAQHRVETVKLNEQLHPFHYWNRGVMLHHLATIKAEQAKIETNKQRKIDLVEKAVLDMEDCLKFDSITLTARPQTRLFDTLGYQQNWLGDILKQLGSLTGEKQHLERAIKAYEEVVQTWEKTDRRSGVAEAHWQIAKLHGRLGNHSAAAQKFDSASETYTRAAEKIPQLKSFYADHAMYMQAWSEIEKAKLCHAGDQYGLAREHYAKAADLHKSTERWRYLSPNYSALARVEEAEDLSRREQTEEAKELFQQAAGLFTEAKGAINNKQAEIDAQEEIMMAADLGKASDIRHEYCLGRIALEEAKILDRQGNHAASSAKYASATESFQKTIDSMENEWDRRELKPIADLCQAWRKMKQAEAETSPDLYLEASKLFDEARKHSLTEKARMLAQGHSCFCKALEAGTRFETTRDMVMYSGAKKHLEAAANYYVKAGFKNASEYARATNRLFDAYMYMHKAETEADPRNKTQNYMIAERLLQSSAGSYMKAKHPEKGEEVQRLLESVREERQLALSLSEVLHAPTLTSTTTSFSSPTATHEQAVGLERFEHADIQANLILRVREVKVDEDVDFRMELVNAGKAPALLIKVDEIFPEDFEIRKWPEAYTIEDSYIDMKGKRLNPLKTEDVKIVVKPRSKGTFIVKPRVLYIDELGKYKSHEPEPVTLTVKELGITGWIKGEK